MLGPPPGSEDAVETVAIQRIAAYLDEHAPRMRDLVRDLVAIESHASQPEGVNAVGDLVCDRLSALGFTDEHAGSVPLPEDQRWLERVMLPGLDYARIGDTRVARWRGTGRGRVLLLGDLDTAFLPGSAERFPFSVEGDRAYGPGVADMKGGLTVLAFACQALVATGLNPLAEITVVLGPDEQAGSLRSRTAIAEAAAAADWVFCLECARESGKLMGARGHIGVAELETLGREAHAGSAHAKGVNAVEAMAHKVPALNALTDPARGIYVSVCTIQGGWRRSVIPGSCTAVLDVRTPAADVWDEVEAQIREIAGREELPGASARLSIAAHRPGLPWTTQTDWLLQRAQHVGGVLGFPIEAIRSPAAGSSAFVGPVGRPCLDGMGPLGGDLMTDREYIEIPSLPKRAALLAGLLHTLGTEA